MALTARALREYVGEQDEISGVLTSSDIFYAGAILAFAAGKLAEAATAQNQAIAGIFTGKCSDGDSVEAKTTGANSTLRGIVKRGKVWLPHTGAAITDVGAYFVHSSDDAMVDVPATATHRYIAYQALDFKAGVLLFDLRNPTVVQNPA